jgi:hypothetical protein
MDAALLAAADPFLHIEVFLTHKEAALSLCSGSNCDNITLSSYAAKTYGKKNKNKTEEK